ncbi:DUF2993 domain-containing protein [uncultured Jatrophihabitans sp.]|uniref:LmeA family phospholipid-binding protein n=1 Tax=uncultured Jatrophihabitans sp. TaxID=1610747 RepID=UPI0035C9A9E2
MLIALAVLALLLLVGVGAVFADRSLSALAERRASEVLSQPFANPATVRVIGRPFVTQALRGRYREVHVAGGGLSIGEMTGATLDARLHTVYLPARDLLRHRVGEITCDRVAGHVVLPFGELARVAPIPGLELTLVGERLMASAALPIPGFSQLARVNGQAVWTVGNGGALWLRVRGISVAGISVPGIVLNQLLPALDVPVTLPELPWGLRIDDLRPTAEGLVVTGSADAPVFRSFPGGRPRQVDELWSQ